MVSIVVKFFVDEISFWSRYVAGFVRFIPFALNFTYVFLELISLFRICMFLGGCVLFLKFLHVPQKTSIIHEVIAPSRSVLIKHKIENEGLSISLSKEGLSLDQVSKITKKINEVIPSSWLYNANISTKVFERNGSYEFDECYISGRGFKIYLKSNHGDIMTEWMQKDSREIYQSKINGNLSVSLSKNLPNPMVKEILNTLQKANKSTIGISNIYVGYSCHAQSGKAPKIAFIELHRKNGKIESILSMENKIYNLNENYSYNDITVMKRPINGGKVTSNYGWRIHPILKVRKMHTGIDYGMPMGSPIYSPADGVISKSQACAGYGNYVEVVHNAYNKKIATGYGHMTKLIVKRNQKVKQGEIIGYVGKTGMATAPHLHYEIKVNGKFVHPHSIKSFYKKMKDAEMRKVQKCHAVYKTLK
ncbi:M23 family metallopeptidase [Candidatus Cytomitobacter indipagum]|uniref:M23 family metallopeptidase n=1 Tax=Candidatus Cytomitobacter indipagum TaxID=2601575 RepID=A0A5C0UEN4_9PROT|nr:M23 family metallopeptidase [Candidatus Cytomitobacter indipagum]QEK38141.1 M23 family metallopeptidase [Candidatus Cytomitobacter indipagum]